MRFEEGFLLCAAKTIPSRNRAVVFCCRAERHAEQRQVVYLDTCLCIGPFWVSFPEVGPDSDMAASTACVAKFEYRAADGEELSISKGEMLTVVDDKGSWWKVKNKKHQSGLVPSNYVEPVAAPQPVTTSSSTRSKFEDQPNQYQQPDLMVSRNGPSLNIKAVAKFKYASTREDEISLEKGDEVIVMEKEADGWWKGRCKTKIGWFPFNYVEEVKTANEPVPVQQPAQPQSKTKSVICSVVALYSFNSGNPEELAFEKGDLMDIIDQPADDPDWWEAKTASGKTGLVPRNYVEIMQDTPPSGPNLGSKVVGAGSGASSTRSPPPFAREPWFYGKVARKEAESKLNMYAKNGEFIVRESETKVSCVCLYV